MNRTWMGEKAKQKNDSITTVYLLLSLSFGIARNISKRKKYF